MNHSHLSPLLLFLALAIPLPAEDAPSPPAAETKPASEAAPLPQPVIQPDGRFVMEFRGARLGQVLDYLSKAAGFVVINAVELPTAITLVARQPLTASEAVDALNGVLFDQGYTVIVRGKTLRVVSLASAKQMNLPVEMGNQAASVPQTDRMVTQIIPVRGASAKDLAENLKPLLNTTSSTLSANDSSNSLILTDTQANIHRIVAIVEAIDTSIISEQQVKVFHLRFADADKVARLINSIYGASSSSTNRPNAKNSFLSQFMQQDQGRSSSRNNGNASGSGTSSRGGEVSAAADSGTNSLVIRCGSGTMDAMAAMVKELDIDTSAKDGVLLYRVRNGKSANIAKSLNGLFQGVQTITTGTSSNGSTRSNRNNNSNSNAATQQATGVAAAPAASGGGGGVSASDSALDLSGQVRVISDDASNSVLVLSPERNFERLKKVLTDLDQPMRQVLVRVLVAEVTIEKGLQLGVQMEGFNAASTNGTDPGASSNLSRLYSDFNLFDKTLGMNGFLLNGTNFRAAIRALATDSRFDVLSRPYVLTTDNQKAVVNVSQEVPIITGTRTDQQNNVISTFERQDVGIILTVTPQINSDGRVLLDVNQELSAVTDQTVPVAKDVVSPIIKKRTMTTRVAVDHGQTVVVGGLVHDSMVESVRKVPVLGDIPFLGALFRYTNKTKAQTELLVFLTPQVVKDPTDLADLSVQLRNEMSHLDAAVQQGTLQRHLDQLMKSKVGEALAAPPIGKTGEALAAPPVGKVGEALPVEEKSK